MSHVHRTSSRGHLVLAAALALIVLLASAAPASARLTRRARATASGQFASASVNGVTVRNPGQIQFRVTSNRQRISLTWSLFCTQPAFRSTSRSGTRDARAPLRFTPSLPRGRIVDCTVSAFASLDTLRAGRVTVAVWAR